MLCIKIKWAALLVVIPSRSRTCFSRKEVSVRYYIRSLVRLFKRFVWGQGSHAGHQLRALRGVTYHCRDLAKRYYVNHIPWVMRLFSSGIPFILWRNMSLYEMLVW